MDKEAVLLAKKKNILSSQLEVTVDDTVYDELLELIDKEQRQSK